MGRNTKILFLFWLVTINEIHEFPKCFVIPQRSKHQHRAYVFRSPGFAGFVQESQAANSGWGSQPTPHP